MLAVLGYAMVAVFIGLIMARRLSPVVGLIVLPLAAGIIAGQAANLGGYVVDGVKSLAPTALLLVFAIMFFSLMIEVGLFDPVVRAILRFSKADPVRITLGTVALTLVVSLDGDGSSTILIVAAAFLALYNQLGMSRVVLAVLLVLAVACTNLTPWGGPVTRAAAALDLDPATLFLPMIPSMIVGAVALFGVAYLLGRRERRRLRTAVPVGAGVGSGGSGTGPDAVSGDDGRIIAGILPERAPRHRRIIWFNALLTVLLMVGVVLEVWPLAVLFAAGFAIALLVNFPSPKAQGEQVAGFAPAVIPVVTMVFAAAVFVGVLAGTGMVDAMGQALVAVMPASWGGAYGLLVGIVSLPLTFVLSNDAYYFGVLPVLAEAGAAHGLTPAEVGRAALVGGPVHVLSPLVPALYLLVGRLDVSLADLQRKGLPWAVLVSLLMLMTAVVTGVVPLG
ncbi:citrate:proton symporter [Pseudonocardia kujensis]|uniref:CitMHS family transporter n=1 Tax=Pseudonocardia kujensis TaxID=1128675 RepID=UPI001E368F4A|nr:citrate:proton symporter [Pseudonocardia kujensis]MCE0763705.1 citrate:proton symporter [Pseudonocardia kujensis]